MIDFLVDFIKIISYILVVYSVYVVVAGIIVYKFLIPVKTGDEYRGTNHHDRFYGTEKGKSLDQVHLVEERYYANQVMNNLINQAEKKIQIAYYMLSDGFSTNVISYNLLKAADRGVQVQILLDGFCGRLFNSTKKYIKMYAIHPNIEIKLYEPFHLLRPYAWNNRMHDKMIIIDDYKLALIGGQNINDQYLTKDGVNNKKFSDRDVVIINTGINNTTETVIHQMNGYFDELFNCEFSKYAIKRLSNKVINCGNKKRNEIISAIVPLMDTHKELFELEIDWFNNSFETNGIEFIHNPIKRMTKEPYCFIDVCRLIQGATKSVLIENPFVIPIKHMKNLLFKNRNKHKLTLLTNSLATNSHVYAHSAYLKHRTSLLNNEVNLYEYQGPDIIHAKSFVIDDRISVVGTLNIDARSTYMSTESMIIIDSRPFSKILMNQINQKIDNSLSLRDDAIHNRAVKKKKVSIVKKGLLILFYPVAYVLDFML